MAARLAAASGLPMIRVGRMAGQFAKPRSAAMEAKDGAALPAYRGDIVNGIAFDAAERRPESRAHVPRLRAGRGDARPRSPERLWTSHEALLLPFEQALVRRDPESGRFYASSAHFLWIGDRTALPGLGPCRVRARPRQPARDQVRPVAGARRRCCACSTS